MYDKPAMVEKARRQAAIVRLVRRGKVGTQGELIKELRGAGLRVDQSTLSRDLSELGIRKSGGRYVSTPPPDERAENKLDLSAAVRRFTTCGPNLIVVSTGLGQAQPVAVAIEQAKDPSILATLAGDDTVFVAVKTRRSQAVALRRLDQWFGDKHER